MPTHARGADAVAVAVVVVVAVVVAVVCVAGRVMGDVSSMFVVYLVEIHQWTPDSDAIVKELW